MGRWAAERTNPATCPPSRNQPRRVSCTARRPAALTMTFISGGCMGKAVGCRLCGRSMGWREAATGPSDPSPAAVPQGPVVHLQLMPTHHTSSQRLQKRSCVQAALYCASCRVESQAWRQQACAAAEHMWCLGAHCYALAHRRAASHVIPTLYRVVGRPQRAAWSDLAGAPITHREAPPRTDVLLPPEHSK